MELWRSSLGQLLGYLLGMLQCRHIHLRHVGYDFGEKGIAYSGESQQDFSRNILKFCGSYQSVILNFQHRPLSPIPFLTSNNLISLFHHTSPPPVALCVSPTVCQHISDIQKLFAKYIADEIRIPLQLSITRLLAVRDTISEQSVESEDTRESLQDVIHSSELAVDVLNEMLLYDRLQSGSVSLEKEDIRIWDFLKEAMKPFLLPVSIMRRI